MHFSNGTLPLSDVWIIFHWHSYDLMSLLFTEISLFLNLFLFYTFVFMLLQAMHNKLFFFFFFFWKFPGYGSNWSCSHWPLLQSQQPQIWASSATYSTAQVNAGSLTHWTRPGIEPVSSWILVGFVATEPQRELHNVLLQSLIILFLHTHIFKINFSKEYDWIKVKFGQRFKKCAVPHTAWNNANFATPSATWGII